jgi:tetratricopeptide (TPR) repeat protein
MSNSESCNQKPAADNRNIGMLTISIAVVCVVVLAVHWPALSAKVLSFDDSQYFTDNPLVQNPGWASAKRFLTEILAPSTVKGYYQPLAMISLMFDYTLGGRENNMMPFHRTSLILHVANTVLIIVLLYILFGQTRGERSRTIWIAAGVGLLFGVHPMTVEPIPWVGERKTLLAAFFALWSLIFYVRYVQKNQRGYYLGGFVMYFLALMSKPTSVPIPVVMLLMDYWPLRRQDRRRAVLEKLPFFVLGGVFAVITYISQSRTAAAAPPGVLGVKHVFLVLCHNIVFYLYKITWPVNLSSHYGFPEPLVLSQPMVLAGVIGTCVLVPLLVFSLRWTRVALTSWLIFFVAIFPTMGVVGFTIVIAADKFAYLPSIGLLMGLTSFLAWFCSKNGSAVRRIFFAAAILITGTAEAAVTRRYLSYWQDSVSFYEYMVRLSPDVPRLQSGLGNALQRQGRIEEAILHYNKAIELKFQDAGSHNYLASALQAQGRIEEAIAHYRKAISFEPETAEVYNNLGGALLAQGRLNEALGCFHEALRIRLEYADAHSNIGIVLARQGKLEEAKEYFSRALQLKPGHVSASNNLGLVLQWQGRTSEAMKYFNQSLQGKPDYAEAHYNLGMLLQSQGRLGEAADHYRQALQNMPDDADVYYRLGSVLRLQGRLDEAAGHFRRALQIDPNYSPAREAMEAIKGVKEQRNKGTE